MDIFIHALIKTLTDSVLVAVIVFYLGGFATGILVGVLYVSSPSKIKRQDF